MNAEQTAHGSGADEAGDGRRAPHPPRLDLPGNVRGLGVHLDGRMDAIVYEGRIYARAPTAGA